MSIPSAEASELADLIEAGVDRTLELAQTWLVWNGVGRVGEDPTRVYTPAKALRRHTDHLLDHLAQIMALGAGTTPPQDEWHGSLVTFAGDWVRITEQDLVEAGQRLRRLALLYRLALADADLSRPGDDNAWTVRAIVEHVAPPWYAEQVGDLR